MKVFSQQIHAFPRRKKLKSVGHPKVDLLDPEEPCVPDPRAPEPEPEADLVDTEQLCIPETDLDLKYYLGTFNDEDIVGSVNTRSRYYRGLHINYYGLPTADRCCSDFSEYFVPEAQFIDKALDKRASLVLICCKQGVEHSVTLFLAYLMICHDMMVEEAIDHVMKSRRIRPSRDVLKKLMLLSADLVQQRKLKLQDIKTGSLKKTFPKFEAF
uniref:Dual specificity phosphatase catalytic domain-containing protein n=1 Tax=Cyprinus carpio TaxID=7962 RepID=A0A8C1M5C5_CYPCA